ncbi:hypothetical protein M0805_002238 [Coniferiporia weirii]|nr:hypothetical protein M0805_002238 [Coniferiporia weirii]
MSTDSPLLSILASGQLYTVVNSLQSTKYLAVACFTLLVYDYFLTFEQEVQLFWRRGLSLTRILFFLNRYFPPANFFIVLVWFFRPLPSHETMLLTSTSTVFELIIMQAILVARVVHLWTWKRSIQRSVLLLFFLSIVIVAIVFGFVMKDTDAVILPIPLRGCFDVSTGSNSHLYWAMLVPTFVMETFLMVLTLVRVVRPLHESEYKNRLLKCLIRDGCMFYLSVCVCVGFGVVGSALWDHPNVSFPAIFSGFLPAILSICASRLLFNLHGLADELFVHPTFALNNVELSRLNLRKGPRHGEFLVCRSTEEFKASTT